MKKAAALLLALALFLFCCPAAFAENDPILLAVNNTVVRPMSRENMPVLIGGEMYIPYQVLSCFTTIKYYYNRTFRQILVYDFWDRITFDLAGGRTFDDKNNTYGLKAVQQGEDVFLPAAVICKKFDFYLSYSHFSDIAPLIRINEGELYSGDREFTEQLYNLLQSVYDAYVESVTPAPPDEPSAPPAPELPNEPLVPQRRLSHIALYGDPALYGEKMLDSLSTVNPAFFLTADEINANGDFVRRLLSGSRTIGIYLDPETGVSLEEQINAANDALRSQVCTTVRLVMVKGGSEALGPVLRDQLIAQGVRFWDATLDATGLPSAELVYHAQENTSTLVFSFALCEETARNINVFKRFLSDYNFTVLRIDDWVTPINDSNDVR